MTDDKLRAAALLDSVDARVKLRLLAGPVDVAYSPTEVAELVSDVIAEQRAALAASAPDEGLAEQGVSLSDIDARLASGYADFGNPLMVAVADVSALRAALAASATHEGPNDDMGHGCSPECNVCREERLARPAVPALDVEAVGRALIRFIGQDASDVDPERFVAEYAALQEQPE